VGKTIEMNILHKIAKTKGIYLVKVGRSLSAKIFMLPNAFYSSCKQLNPPGQ
jgi:hypothetical protein